MVMLIIPLLITGSIMASIHPDFVSLGDLCKDIKINSNYGTMDNFTGSIVAGYKAQKAYMAKGPAEALCKVQNDLLKEGMAIKIFDGYRPVKAVQFFIDWAKKPEDNPQIKELYYPTYTRIELFEKGFIAKQSSHSRGSAVDLTIYELKTGRDLDMGSGFDYFDELSHTNSTRVTSAQNKNRMLLKKFMEHRGFTNFSQEWWHYSFKPEPFPSQSFDFDIE